MKHIILLLLLLGICLPASAQFRRSSDNGIYPYITNLNSSDVFITGRPGVTNYNYAFSNMARFMTNVASYYSTNGVSTNVIYSKAGTNIIIVTNSPTLITISAKEAVTNAYITNLYATFEYVSNAFITNLIANNTYVSNAYITNLTVVNFSGLTNNTDRAGVVVGSGVGSNLTAYARLDAVTNNFTGSMGVNVAFGTATATADTLFVASTIRGVYTNLQARWDHEGFLRGTNITVADNFFSPTNAAVVGQVLHATSTAGATKWDYVNQVLTNSNPVVPDFTLPVNYFVTNAAFLFLAPAGVETTGKKLQVTDVIVTNSTAAAVAVTFPGSIRVTGTANITNLSVFHFRQFAGKWTNVVCEPVW